MPGNLMIVVAIAEWSDGRKLMVKEYNSRFTAE
jgi:hypothetical protein